MPVVGQPIEYHSSFRFTVTVDNIEAAAFVECNLPSLTVETDPIKEGGQNTYTHKLPVRVDNGTVTLRRGVTKNDTMLNWYLQILRGDVKNATRKVTVTVFDSMSRPVAIWTFNQAYPIKWGGPSLKSGDSAAAIEEVEFAFHGFEVG
jgi:phage tail-like protein